MNFLKPAIFSLLLTAPAFGQTVTGISTGAAAVQKPIRGWNIHAAYNYAVIDNKYEVRGQYKSGIQGGLVYRFGQWFAIEGSFTRFRRHESFSLTDIQAWTADLNGNLSMRIGESDMYFRSVFGIGYVDWKGIYIGPNLNDNNRYYYGMLLNDRFYSGNFGCGFSHFFMKQRIEGFGDFKLRFAGDKKVGLVIIDTHFVFGLRYSLTGSQKDSDKSGNAKRKPNSEKKRRVYKWMKERK